MVTFLIGLSAQKFLIHKERVCHHSPVLKAAFNGNFIEGQTQTYRIEDTSPGAFRMFTRWIYDQDLDLFQLKTVDQKERDVRLHTISPEHSEDIELAELWVLADKMAMHKLQNFIVRQIVEIRNQCHAVAIKTLPYIYNRTAVNSPLRGLMISEVAQHCHEDEFDDPEDFPHEFLIDLAKYNTYRPAVKDQQESEFLDFFVYGPNEEVENEDS
jgi:hypothetical protein